MDPGALLYIQNTIIAQEKTQRSSENSVNPVVLHTNQLDDRTIAYLSIDINHRLLVSHHFINVLRVIKNLDDQFPIDVMREVNGKDFHRRNSNVSM